MKASSKRAELIWVSHKSNESALTCVYATCVAVAQVASTPALWSLFGVVRRFFSPQLVEGYSGHTFYTFMQITKQFKDF